MKILVLGGAAFVGRAIVEQALGRGDEVTLFSRGRTGLELFPGIARLTGDRESGDYTSLVAREWDAVIDVSGYVPRHVQQASAAIRAGRYLFISTGSVYDLKRAPEVIAEDAPRLAPERNTEVINGDTYGPLKVACEDDVLSLHGSGATIVRPGIVAGPYDMTDRFTYWVRRAARGGRVALAGRPDQPVQVVDSRDLAQLVVQLVHDDRAGVFNAVGPAEPVTLQGLIQTCARAAGSSVEIVAMDAALADPTLPLVLADPASDVAFTRSSSAAREVGLTATPLETTAADVLAWDTERGAPALGAGLTEEQEAALLHR